VVVADPTDRNARSRRSPRHAARVIAFSAILVGGFAGGLIGYTLVKLQCDGDCAVPLGKGHRFLGAVVCGDRAWPSSSVLALRAMGEWREISDRERAGHAPR
jgi:hypothetical protein